jgi:hypothetical protein
MAVSTRRRLKPLDERRVASFSCSRVDYAIPSKLLHIPIGPHVPDISSQNASVL